MITINNIKSFNINSKAYLPVCDKYFSGKRINHIIWRYGKLLGYDFKFCSEYFYIKYNLDLRDYKLYYSKNFSQNETDLKMYYCWRCDD
jgi:hypothetical protein